MSTPHTLTATPGVTDPHALNGHKPHTGAQHATRSEAAERRPGNGDAFRALLPKLLPLVKPYKRLQIEIVIYLIMAAACNVATPLVVKYFLRDFQAFFKLMRHETADPSFYFHSSVLRFVGLLACIYMAGALVSLRRTDAVNRLSQNVLNALQLDLFTHLLRLPHSFYSRSKQGDLMTCLTSDIDNVQSAVNQLTNKSLYQVFLLIGGIIGLIFTTGFSILTLLILLILPLFALAYVGLRTRNKTASREQRKIVGQTAALAQEQLAAQDVIKAYGLEQRVTTAFNTRIQAQRQSRLRLARLSALTDVSEDLATAFAQLLILGMGGYLVLFHPRSGVRMEDLIASLLLIKYIIGPVASLSGIGQTIQQASGSMDRVCQLLDEPVVIGERPGATELPTLSGEIRLDHVSFGYDEDNLILNDISFAIPAGSHVAIVGPTGCGKSTLLNLLMRFWDPQHGRVLFDGHDLRDVTVASHRSKIGLVFQDAFIFDMTISENIALGRPDASEEEVIAAARAAHLDDDIQNMPDGYDTVLGERGVRLSGGQRQRLSIARAILRDPAILVLDEATSALDAQTEAALMETIFHLKRGRTVVSVTHRLSWAKEADTIFVLNHAGIVEQGTHEELVNAGGLYQTLYQEQSGRLAAPAA